MTWAIIALGVLTGAGGLIVLIGVLLPKRHIAVRSLELLQRPEDVWQVVSDIENSPSWRPDVRAIESLPAREGRPVWREVDSKGQGLPLETIEVVPPRRLVRRIADPTLPFGGTWTIEIEPRVPRGARVVVSEDGEVYNPVFRFVSRFVMGHTATIDRYLKALAKHFGEDARPQ
jgi:hypothetical protein